MTISRTTTASPFKGRSASKSKRRLTQIALALSTVLTPVWGSAEGLPTGGTVVHGNANISTPSSNTMIINQGSDRAVVNWDGFSIGAGKSVNINQPGVNSAILNRVTGDTTSQIHGQLNANGRVFVVNPNGIFIGATGSVNTGSFVASTLGIRTDDFATGNLVFEGDGSSGTVSNAGSVQVVTGGYAALIGGKVKNSGTIQAPLGFVGLGSGERITLDLSGDGFLQVAVPTNSDDAGLEALIENSGTIQANGGTVQISAATARNAARHAINMSGIVEARSVSGRNGRVTLGGGLGGKVTVTGRVSTATRRSAIQVVESARPTARPQRGGDITITGQNIALAGADIDASGLSGGGTVRIGGNERGAPGLMTADTLSGTAETLIRADALAQGGGGRIALWSEISTEFAGQISARGGPDGGDGGFVEVSGKSTLSYSGSADTRASLGAWGTLLLDPDDIFVVEVLTGLPGEVTAASIEANLTLNGQVELLTTDTGGFDLGDIVVDAPLTWTSDSELILTANNSITINAPITATAGQLTLETLGVLPVSTGPDGDIDVGTFYLIDGNWEQVSSDLPEFSAGNFFIHPDGEPKFVGDLGPFIGSEFLRATGGDGSTATPYQITDVFGLQGIGTFNGGTDNYVLANDIDASGTIGWEELAPGLISIEGLTNEGLVPYEFNGDLDGAGHTITGLFARQFGGLGDGEAGLFKTLLSDGSVTDLTIAGADLGGDSVGIVAATNDGFVQGVAVSGAIEVYDSFGIAEGGGIAGINDSGFILDSTADVTITDPIDPSLNELAGADSLAIGGIAGANDGTIERSNSSGTLSATRAFNGFVGGIAGLNAGDITDSYSVADVSGDSSNGNAVTVGGITGDNLGTLTNVLANGPVTLLSVGSLDLAGGITGDDDDLATNIVSSFFNTTTTGQILSGQSVEDTAGTLGSGAFEGALAVTTAELNDALAFTDLAEEALWDFGSTWSFPQDGVDFSRLYSTSPVISAAGPLDAPEFVYNGTTTGFSVEGSYAGGPGIYLFGPIGDTGDLTVMDDQIELSEANVGARTFTFPTSFTSDLGQVFDVRSIPEAATVTPAPLTVTADDQTKGFGTEFVFDGTEFTVLGLLSEQDIVESATLTSVGAPADAPFTGTAGVAIVITDPVGRGLDNYAITLVNGVMIIAPRNLTITANDQIKGYGTEFVFDGTEFTVEGLVDGDSVDSVTLTSAGAAGTAQVADAPFSILVSDPVGTGLDAYTLTFADGSFTIVPAPLTVTANDQTKQEGLEFTFTGTEFSVAGLQNADTVTSAVLSSDGAEAAALAVDSPFDILVGTVEGTGLGNYEITTVNGTFNVEDGAVITPPVVNPIPGGESTIPNPPDVIDIAFPGDGASRDLGGVQNRGGGSGSGQTLEEAEDAFEVVDTISTEMELAIQSCGSADQDFTNYMACLSESLDTYANALDQIATDLPAGLETVSATIRTAAQEVKAATSRAQRRLATATSPAQRRAIQRDAVNEARGAINNAKSEIRKAISLIRADDPEVAAVQRRTGARIVQAFDTVDSALVRAVEL